MVLNPRCEIWKYFDNIVEEGVAVCKLCKQRLRNERSYALRKHINKLHNTKSDVWKYYVNFVEQGVAECKICLQRVRNNRHFNLLLHLKKHNVTTVEENANTATTTAAADAVDGQNDDAEVLYILMEEKCLVNAVMGLIIDEGLVPPIFASKNMQALLNPLCDAISKQNDKNFYINELQTEQVIHSVASFIRADFAKDLHWHLLSLRIDSIASVTTKIFCVSVQHVHEAQLKTCVLGQIHLEDGHELSGECIVNLLRKFNISTQQIVSACWDNSKANLSHCVSNLDYLEQTQEFEKYPDVFIGDLKLERYVGVIAQLCILDVLKNPLISKLFFECRNLAKFINAKPAVFSEAFKQCNLNMPHLDSPWKWGSTYDMMSDLKNACCILSDLKYEPLQSAEDGFNFNETLKDFIDAFCKTLRVLQKCLRMFYSSEMIYGDFYGHWLKCKLLTEKLYATCSKEDTFLSLISSQLLKSLEARSNELLNQDHFSACLYLDPRFQGTLNMPEKMFALEYLKQLWQRNKLYNKEAGDAVAEPQSGECASQSSKMDDDDDDDDILNKFLSKIAQETGPTGIYKKLEELRLPFQMVETNVMLYWEELQSREPQIYTLAAICFAIPATHKCNKVLWSNPQPFDGFNNVSPIVKEDVNFIRLNQQLLPEALENLNLFQEGEASQMNVSKKQGTVQDSMTTAATHSEDDLIPNI